jgi:CheY-like chemotaxis protein
MSAKSTVLVVEDEEPMRELLRFNLREARYRVFTAGSAGRRERRLIETVSKGGYRLRLERKSK